MTSKTGSWLVVSTLAVAVLWAAPAQAYSCQEEWEDCMVYARQDPDDRVREYREQECNQNYDYCNAQPVVCGDNYCGYGEDCSTCPGDCGSGNATVDQGTTKRNCTSSVLSTSIAYWGGYQVGAWCYYPVQQYVAVTCGVYRKYAVYTCNSAPTTQEVYEGNSTEYGWYYTGTYYSEYGTCHF
jgi:hypothetical protein